MFGSYYKGGRSWFDPTRQIDKVPAPILLDDLFKNLPVELPHVHVNVYIVPIKHRYLLQQYAARWLKDGIFLPKYKKDRKNNEIPDLVARKHAIDRLREILANPMIGNESFADLKRNNGDSILQMMKPAENHRRTEQLSITSQEIQDIAIGVFFDTHSDDSLWQLYPNLKQLLECPLPEPSIAIDEIYDTQTVPIGRPMNEKWLLYVTSVTIDDRRQILVPDLTHFVSITTHGYYATRNQIDGKLRVIIVPIIPNNSFRQLVDTLEEGVATVFKIPSNQIPKIICLYTDPMIFDKSKIYDDDGFLPSFF